MIIGKRCSIGCCSAIVIATLALAETQPAGAQSFLLELFGGFRREPLPHRSSSYADPRVTPEHGERRRPAGETSGSTGRGAVFCVRLCDGRYFPLQRHAGTTPAEACRALCPAAKTMVFSGSRIDSAVAPNRVRYADLDQAFAYRDKEVPNCTCNGREGGGLARIDATTDPTLRPGDIVATSEGLAIFKGKHSTAEFTRINPSSGEWARRLSEMKVRPAPPQQPVDATVAAGDDAEPKLRSRRAPR